MDKLIKLSQSGMGVQRLNGPSVGALPLEKRSDAAAAQARWLAEDVNRIDPRITEWIRQATLDHDRYAYALVVPLGADESWEETVNGDAFLRKDLQTVHPEWGHKTFETHAKAFRHHVNSDPERGFGGHPLMVYNVPSDRCEGIWQLDREKARDVGSYGTIEKLESGRVVSLSMGCRVPFDVCSLCGNEATSPAKYCIHPKNPGFGHIDPFTGKKSRVFNPKPLFFDLSDVTVPAAPESATLAHLGRDLEAHIRAMTKTSGVTLDWPVIPSALLASAVWRDPYEVVKVSAFGAKRSSFKVSDLTKYAPALAVNLIAPMQRTETTLEFPPSPRVQQTIVTLAGLGIVLSFPEFVSLLRTAGELAEGPPPVFCPSKGKAGFTSGLSEAPLEPGWFNAAQATSYRKYVEPRSMFLPHLGRRAAWAEGGESAPQGTSVRQLAASVQGRDLSAVYGSYVGQVVTSLRNLMASLRERFDQFDTHFLGADSTAGEVLTAGGTKQSTSLDPAVQAVLPAAYVLGYVGLASDPDSLHLAARQLGR